MDEAKTEGEGLKNHNWPKTSDVHIWTAWKQNGRTSQYRRCVHPECHAYQTTDAPKG